jgi:hypothetical protein
MFWKTLWRKLSKERSAPPSPRATSRTHSRTLLEVEVEPDETSTVEYWVKKLTMRLARLHRFRELDAPSIIIEAELELVDQAIQRVGPKRALSVMRQWRELHRVVDPETAAQHPSTRARRYVEPN